MANKYFRSRKMSPIQKELWQLTNIRKTYSNIESSSMDKKGFKCVMNITPSANSDTYKVEISYKYGSYPQAKLLSHKLEKRNNKYPHHIFGFDKNDCAYLCVFHGASNEWNRDMLISETFIPWVSTWLNTYEFWLITGEWHYDEIINGQEKIAKDGGKNDTTNKTTN